MWKSKKAQAGLGDTLSNILQTMPRPLLLVIFLVFLLLFTAVFSYILNFVGVHCNSEDKVYTIPVYDLIINLELTFKRPATDELSGYAVKPETTTVWFVPKCVTKLNDTFYFDGAYCTQCESAWIVPPSSGYGLPDYSARKVCLGNVTYNPTKGWLKKMLCANADGSGTIGCDVPIGYYFDSSNGYFIPIGNSTSNYLTVAQMWDRKLEDLGGSLLYTSEIANEKAYNKAFKLTCHNLKPTLKFYGIPLFDYKMWLLLLVIGLLITALVAIGQMDK